MIKAVIFDFFGVICSDDYWQFVKHDGLDDSSFRTYSKEVNLGQIPWQVFVSKIAGVTGKSVGEVNEMYETERIDPRMTGMILEIHRNYKTGLLTNAHHEFIDTLLAENNLAEIFDAVIVSSRLGIVKPNPQIFEYALEKLNVSAADTVYIDDLTRHIDSASELGMKTILFENFEQCKEELDIILSSS
jgi:epoxide hydrolase-like predicted phosphatase